MQQENKGFDQWAYGVKALSDGETPFPGRSQPTGLADMRKSLITALNAISVIDPWKYLAQVQNELETYTWCVPADPGNPNCTESLYDRARTLCAVAGCLYQTREDQDQPFLLVVGDFAGIQKYIYGIPHRLQHETENAKGSARALRGRSLRVRLITEDVASHLLVETGFPLANRILTAGGRLYLLLPNTESVANTVKRAEQRLGDWSLKKTNGELRFALSITPTSVASFHEAQRRANEDLDERTTAPLKQVLVGGGWEVSRFEGQQRDIRDEFKPDALLGSEIPRCTAACLIPDVTSDHLPFSKLELTNDQTHREEARIVLRWPGDKDPVGVRARVARYVPRNGSELLTFDEMAEKALGRQMLGFLKADIDDLGFIFGSALANIKTASPLSSLVTLSRALESFAAGFVDELVAERFPQIYVVYAGGDDMFLVGPWDQTLQFAIAVQQKFVEFMAGNKHWGISVGISMAVSGTGILQAEADAEKLLKRAKRSPGKNSLAVFDLVLGWKEARAGIEQGKRLLGWLQNDVLSVGQVRRHMEYTQMAMQYLDLLTKRQSAAQNPEAMRKLVRQFAYDREPYPLRFVYLLENDLRRNWGRGRKHKLNAEQSAALDWAAQLLKLDLAPANDRILACEYALTANRKKREE
ncbi:MAG: hypothetical protein H6508_08180 [Calditrichaeota bacterium]|nr:hypothetical protein [Calditrichota bacterium]